MPFVENAKIEARASPGYDEQTIQDDAKATVGAVQDDQVLDIEKEEGVLTIGQCVSGGIGYLRSSLRGRPSTGSQDQY